MGTEREVNQFMGRNSRMKSESIIFIFRRRKEEADEE